MKNNFAFSLVLLAVFSMGSFGFVRAEDPEPQKVSKKIELFDGKSLANWYVFMKGLNKGEDPDKVFTVHDGMIHISGNGLGGITTNEAFKDYQLILEFKWGEKTWGNRVDRCRDSGLLFHSVGKDGAFGGVWMYSIEANIIEGGMGDFIVVGDRSDRFSITAETAQEKSKKNAYISQKGGKPAVVNSGRVDWYLRDPDWEDVKNFRGKNDLDKPVGEWNTMRLVCNGDKVDVYFNGTLVNHAYDVRPSGGRIQIQTEMAELFVRRITLLPLYK